MKKTRRKKKTKLTPEQIANNRKTRIFQKKIRDIFTITGFKYINTRNMHIEVGNRRVEIDSMFLYENILLICEDTSTTVNIKDHIRSKKEAFEQIEDNFSEFIKQVINICPEHSQNLKKYSNDRFKIFFLYFSQNDLGLGDDDLARYPNIKFIEPQKLNYFNKIISTIKVSGRFEIFRFLNISVNDIGLPSSESSKKTIKAPIICPNSSTGLKNNIRLVSFMMSAESLISTCYVLRKDNWENSMWLYQRLIEKEKIKKIREFLVNKGETFFNNIIVALPDNIKFTDSNDNYLSIDQICDYQNCTMEIPNQMNSICIIDGQHRIYAHYEGEKNKDKNEKTISELRQKLHLLVTGLIFPKEMTDGMRAQIQSEIFLDINSNAKPVPADVLLHITTLKYPCSDIGLARQVIGALNRKNIFLNQFELSSLEDSKIKVASIIKFALRYLVTINPSEGRVSLFNYWDGNKSALISKDQNTINEYVEFCAKKLSEYFSALKNNFKEDWNDPNSKILSVISINGFIIAYTRQLKINGLKDFNFFNTCFSNLSIDFSQQNFPYTSSQYKKFSNEILLKAFNLY